jgi:hypothetical protein
VKRASPPIHKRNVVLTCVYRKPYPC